MKLLVSERTVELASRWAERLLLTIGLGLLGYCGYVVLDARLLERAANVELEELRRKPGPAAGAAVPPADRHLVGRLEIARLDLSIIVMEGTSSQVLRRSAGHIPGTALPGRPGNVGISAHRDTFFLPLRNIQLEDIITLTTADGEYRYRVVSTRIVPPTDVSVLLSEQQQVLTLVTCYPFYFIGAAPNRFIVRAERLT